jgi:hypothetical protein
MDMLTIASNYLLLVSKKSNYLLLLFYFPALRTMLIVSINIQCVPLHQGQLAIWHHGFAPWLCS